MAVAGDILYVGVGMRVVAFETDPEWRPAAQSSTLPALVEGVSVADGLVVAALGEAGIAVLDGDSLDPTGSLELTGSAHAVAIGNGLAYVAASRGGLQVVDLSDPSAPALLGAVRSDGEVLGVAIGADDTLVMAAGSAGLLLADASDPRAPAVVGELFTGGYARGVQVVGSMAYFADSWGGLRLVDISEPSEPRLVGTMPTAGWAWHVAVANDVAYLAAGSQGLVVADVRGAAEPTMLANAPLAGTQAVAVAVSDSVAFVVDPFEGVQVVDVASPAAPRPIGTWQSLLEGWGVAVNGDRAYVAAGRAGLRTVDISEPARPRDLGALPTIARANTLTVFNDVALVSTLTDAGSEEVYALIEVDVRADMMRSRSAYGQLGRPGQAMFVEEQTHTGAGPAVGRAQSGSVVVYGIEHGILIVDVGQSPPCEMSFIQTSADASTTSATGVAINGDVAFVGIAGGGDAEPLTLALNISDPHDPEALGSVVGDSAKGVLANGPWLYGLGFGDNEANTDALYVYDVADPSAARQVGLLNLPALVNYFSTQTMAFMSGRLFIAAGEGGLLAVDVSEPSRPRIAGRLTVPGQTVSVVAVGGYLYVGSDVAGLLVVDIDPLDAAAPAEPSVDDLPWAGLTAPVSGDPVAIAPASVTDAEVGCTVTTTLDDGPGSLRDCLRGVRPGQAVTFDPALFSPDQPATIQLSNPLGLDAGGITVDGGGGVILDGSAHLDVGDWAGFETSFELIKDGVTLRGLRIEGFRTGLVVSSNGNTIENNVIAGNLAQDLYLHASSGNRIVGNFVGVDESGTPLAIDPSNAPGLDIDSGSSMNLIEGNLFGGSVTITDPGSYNNSFIGNRVGVDVSRRPVPAPCGAAPYCQLVLDVPFNRAGGLLPAEGNVVAWRILVRPGSVALGNEVAAPD